MQTRDTVHSGKENGAAPKNGSTMQKRDHQPRKPRRAELYADMIDCVTALLGDLGVTHSVAQVLANRLADHLASRWGGQVVSIPRDYAFPLSPRELLILAAREQGGTVASITRTFDMSERGLHNLMRRAPRRLQGMPPMQVRS